MFHRVWGDRNCQTEPRSIFLPNFFYCAGRRTCTTFFTLFSRLVKKLLDKNDPLLTKRRTWVAGDRFELEGGAPENVVFFVSFLLHHTNKKKQNKAGWFCSTPKCLFSFVVVYFLTCVCVCCITDTFINIKKKFNNPLNRKHRCPIHLVAYFGNRPCSANNLQFHQILAQTGCPPGTCQW